MGNRLLVPPPQANLNSRRECTRVNLEMATPFDVGLQLIDSLQDTSAAFDAMVADAIRTEDDAQLGRLIRKNLNDYRELIIGSID